MHAPPDSDKAMLAQLQNIIDPEVRAVILVLTTVTTDDALDRALQYADTCGVSWKTWAPWVFMYGHEKAWTQARAYGATFKKMLVAPCIKKALQQESWKERGPITTSPLNLLIRGKHNVLLQRMLDEGFSPHSLLPLSPKEHAKLPGAPPALPCWVLACAVGSSAALKKLYDRARTLPVPEEARPPEGTTWYDWALYALALCQKGTDLYPVNFNNHTKKELRWTWWTRLCHDGGNPCALLPLHPVTLPLSPPLSEATPAPPPTDHAREEVWNWLYTLLNEQGATLTSPVCATTPLHVLFQRETRARSAGSHPLATYNLWKQAKNAFVHYTTQACSTSPSTKGASRHSLTHLPLNSKGEDPLRALYAEPPSLDPIERREEILLKKMCRFAPHALASSQWKDILRKVEKVALYPGFEEEVEAIFQSMRPSYRAAPPALITACLYNVATRLIHKRHANASETRRSLTSLSVMLEDRVDKTSSPAYQAWSTWKNTLLATIKTQEESNLPHYDDEVKRRHQEALLLAIALPSVAAFKAEAPTKAPSSFRSRL